jgi:hypothetical protein
MNWFEIMLADTPWTFPFVFAWIILSIIAPLVLITAVVLAILPTTRHVGVVMLMGGMTGALLGCLGDVGLALSIGEHLADTTLSGWLFAAAGGFSLFGTATTLFAKRSTSRAG